MPAELGADAQVGDAELAACVVTLRKLADYRPAQLKREAQPGQRFAELWELGVALFGPAAVKQRFKGQDVVSADASVDQMRAFLHSTSPTLIKEASLCRWSSSSSRATTAR
eukprot:SAG31_NODE_2045_length_6576_cov_3.774587_4_plen_111_part_00